MQTPTTDNKNKHKNKHKDKNKDKNKDKKLAQQEQPQRQPQRTHLPHQEYTSATRDGALCSKWRWSSNGAHANELGLDVRRRKANTRPAQAAINQPSATHTHTRTHAPHHTTPHHSRTRKGQKRKEKARPYGYTQRVTCGEWGAQPEPAHTTNNTHNKQHTQQTTHKESYQEGHSGHSSRLPPALAATRDETAVHLVRLAERTSPSTCHASRALTVAARPARRLRRDNHNTWLCTFSAGASDAQDNTDRIGQDRGSERVGRGKKRETACFRQATLHRQKPTADKTPHDPHQIAQPQHTHVHRGMTGVSGSTHTTNSFPRH